MSCLNICLDDRKQYTNMTLLINTFISQSQPQVKYVKPDSAFDIKGIVHPKMKIIPRFTHPQTILGEYDFVLWD